MYFLGVGGDPSSLVHDFILFYFILFFNFYLFIYDREREREREREAETQAEGEAGSMHLEPEVGFIQ